MLLKIQDLQKTYNNLNVIENINLSVESVEIVAIIGPSACGKTTLLNIISGLDNNYKGSIERETSNIGYVFQEDRILPWLTVYENIKLVKREVDKNAILNLIDLVGLNGFRNYYPHSLSGGMKQRCAIARALYYGSELLLMDEPFKSLDYGLRLDMLKMIVNIWSEKKNGILFITHEIDEAIRIANKIVVLSKRPSTVLHEFRINISNKERSINTHELIKIKEDIIKLIL